MIPFSEKKDFSNRLKGKDVKDFESVEILDEGKWIDDVFKDKSTGEETKNSGFWMKVKYKGQEKEVKVSRASFEALSPEWGQDTKNWIGKVAIITVQNYTKGKGITLKPKPETAWD